MNAHGRLLVGFAARLFGGTRSALQEVEFGGEHGFGAIQFRGHVHEEKRTEFGNLATLAIGLEDHGLVPTMELLIGLDSDGRTDDGRSPVEVLGENLQIITTLGIRFVHWHLYPLHPENLTSVDRLNEFLPEQCLQAISLAHVHQFAFGIENNDPDMNLLSEPGQCGALLDRVPDLNLVWDFNHSRPEHGEGFQQLASRISVLHVSDSPLPKVNYHLPLGQGTIDVAAHVQAVVAGGFGGPAVLEIGGLPKSGGYGRDTDMALIASKVRLETMV